MASATVIAQSAMFPRDRVMASLCKYAIRFSDDEPTEALRDKLADFYARRTLIQQSITPEDQAEAIAFLVGDASAARRGKSWSSMAGCPRLFCGDGSNGFPGELDHDVHRISGRRFGC